MIKYVVKDVREPIGEGNKLIVHCVNDLKRMGAGVALALLKKWPQVRSEYIKWGDENKTDVIRNIDGTSPDSSFSLGNIQYVKVENDIVVINMIGQHGVTFENDVPPVRYEAVREGLKKVYSLAKRYNASVNVPYLMCCDLAGGSWDVIEKIIEEELCSKGIEVIAYDVFNKRGI